MFPFCLFESKFHLVSNISYTPCHPTTLLCDKPLDTMPLPPNADTIAYPAHNPTVILSVSEDALDFEAGLDAPLDLYVERFLLKKTLTTKNTNAKDPTQYGLYTNTISVAHDGPDRSRLSLDLSGADGGYIKQADQKDETLVKNGFDGGIMNLYVQDIDHETVQSFFLNGK